MKKIIAIVLAGVLLALGAVAALAATGVIVPPEKYLEHNANYNVQSFGDNKDNYVYDNLDKFTKAHKYFHDETMDPGKGSNKSDSFSGVLSSDKTIDIYYGYNNKITINYLDVYTGEQIASSSVVTLEHNSAWDVSGKIPANVAKNDITYNYLKKDTEEVKGDKLDSDKVINVYYDYNHKITIKFVDKYTGNELQKYRVVFDKATENFTPVHGSDYDVSKSLQEDAVLKRVLRETGENYDFIDEIKGDEQKGKLDSDKEIVVSLGYYHKITINYHDKYTGETIQSEIITVDEAMSEYNLTSVQPKKIAANNIDYHYDAKEGDELSGILDEDKNTVLYYGYDNEVTVNFRDTETKETLAVPVSFTREHLSEYDCTNVAKKEIGGYKRLAATTGDTITGSLDKNKDVTVWYTKKAAEKAPETGDKNPSLVIWLSVGMLAVCGAALTAISFIKKSKKNK